MSAAVRRPVRTCVGCRLRADQAELIRLAVGPDGEVRVDPGRRIRGRGAYVHPDEACVQTAVRRGALARALRTGSHAGGAVRLLQEVRAASTARAARPTIARTDTERTSRA